jgi:hypothetical protein
MRRWVMLLCFSGAIAACNGDGVEPTLSARHELFAGEWRSVTPTLEFLRLTVQSKSSERDVLAARLTFSGVYWEGSGRIAGDSLVLHMTVLGQGEEVRTLVARILEGGTLRTRFESETASALAVDFVREY